MRKAFTMLELVVVIVVIGILAVIAMPRFDKKEADLYNAAKQIVSDIRYTQHLAMIDDLYDKSDSQWYKERWQLLFGKSNSGSKNSGGYYAYTIFSDKLLTHGGNPDPEEIALNPLDRSKLLSGGFSNTLDWEDARASKRMNIGYTYGIKGVSQSGCGAKRIAFDHLGRPLKGKSDNWSGSYQGSSSTATNLLENNCTFTLCLDDCNVSSADEKVSVRILPETGFVCILNSNNECI